MKVVGLHGRQQMGVIFAQRLKKVCQLIEGVADTEFFFPDGPFELPLKDGQSVATRSWFEKGDWQPAIIAVGHALQHCLATEEPVLLIAFSQGCQVATLLSLLATMDQSSLQTTGLPTDAISVLLWLESHLRLVVCAGGPANKFPASFTSVCGMDDDGCLKPVRRLTVPSIHFAGKHDPVVSVASSQELAKLYLDAECIVHDKGHVFPSATATLQPMLTKLQALQQPVRLTHAPSSAVSSFTATDEQLEEMEGLQAVFEDAYELVREQPPTIAISLDEAANGARLMVTLTPNYPETSPEVTMVGLTSSLDVASKHQAGLVDRVMKEVIKPTIEENEGSPMIFMLASEAKTWLEDQMEAKQAGTLELGQANKQQVQQQMQPLPSQPKGNELVMQDTEDALTEDEVQALIDASTQTAAGIAQEFGPYRPQDQGAWKYTVGLVGKPSAGKSTFFNAITDPEREEEVARVAAFPFTTIDPNVGQGYFGAPCPSQRLGVTAHPSNGWLANGTDRKVAVIIKDVAGLVPGAYQGRGKGNAFLNDLCDADVLVHIVDASGKSDKEGVTSNETSGDPCDDIQWVREELHRWIYNNVRHKWAGAARREKKFYGMFSGYQCKRDMVEESLKRCGIDVQQPLDEVLPSWQPKDLHLLVANFLRVRFPILLGLNKVDLDDQHVTRIVARYPNEPMSVMVARSEWSLCQLRRQGKAQYVNGAETFTLDSSIAEQGAGLQQAMSTVAKCSAQLGRSSEPSTGVNETIKMAVELAPPLLVYPTTSLDSCESLPFGSRPDVLSDCLLMKPGSTIFDVFKVLSRPPLAMLDGEFVRAEGRDPNDGDGKAKILRKSDVLLDGCVVKIMTNKRHKWQHKAREGQRAK
eukprot:TRINITY_DN11210_c0_g1_i3.p1 TRINITY_DN11210_c0_g1~~TRINITY_DN11210_c0_g1_i3.p1  ORF type:complete len:868 (+),score=173.75 TRINITY_DN11210_c0_g1_i3:92-2695(+)